MANTSAETETAASGSESAELKALQELKAMKEAFASLLPQPSVEDKGTIDRADGETLAGALLVHHAMRSVAEQLAEKVKAEVDEAEAGPGTRVFIVRSLDQASDRFIHKLVVLRLEELTARARSLLASMEQPPRIEDREAEPVLEVLFDPVTVGGLTAVAGAAVDLLIGATQSNLTIREASMTLKRSALIAPVVDRLLDRDVPVVIDEVAGLSPGNAVVVALAALLRERDKLAASAAWTRAAMVEGEGARLIAELTELIKTLRAKIIAEADEAVRKRLEADLARAASDRAARQDSLDLAKYKADLADGVVAAIGEYVAAITTASESSPAPLLAASFQAEITENDLMLFIEAATAGGGSLWKKAMGPDKALHQGGTAVSWILSTGSGLTRGAGVEVALSSQNSKPDESIDLRRAAASTITT